MSGTVIDKATAFKNSITGAGINKIVCKSSSHDLMGPKKKHVDYLISLTNDQLISMPDLADMLAERTRNTSWVVVMKALITAHNMMVLGNERFLQCMASRPNAFYLDGYVDRSSNLAIDMSMYIRNYARYLKTLCHVYRQITLDVLKVKRGENGEFAKMDIAKLLKSLGLLSDLVEAHLDLNVNTADMRNGVVNTCFLMMYKDLVRLYQTYNDAMISLLEKFFEMKKPQAKEAVELYRKCPARLEAMSEFFKVAEELGLDTRSHLDLKPVPHDLLPALEDHVKDMDKKTPTQSATGPLKLNLRSKQATNTTPKSTKTNDTVVPEATTDFVEEQKRRLEQFNKAAKKKAPLQKATTITTPDPAVNSTPPSQKASTKKQSSSLNDLLGIDLTTATQSGSPSEQWTAFNTEPTNPFSSGYQEVDFFKTQPSSGTQSSLQPNFEAAFNTSSGQTSTPGQNSSFDVLEPVAVSPYASKPHQLGKPEKGQSLGKDVNEGLSTTVKGLSLETGAGGTGVAPKKTQHQWKPVDNKKTGGPNWQPAGVHATTLPPVGQYGQPMVQPMVQPMGTSGWTGGTTPMYGYPQVQMGMGVGMGMGMYQPMQPMGYNMPPAGMQPGGVQQRPQDPFGPIPGGQARF